MLFSILIAAYNAEKYIKQSIDSAICQTYNNIEVIVCDDFSVDGTNEILLEYKLTGRIILLNNDSNRGVGFTKRKLIENSSGQYFAFLDADDILEANAVELLVNFLIQKPNASLVYTSQIYINSDSIVLKKNSKSKETMDLFKDSFLYPIFHFVVFTRVFYNKTEGINCKFKSAEDLDIWLKMEEVGKIYYLNKYLYRYRIHENGISQCSNNTKKWLFNLSYHLIALSDASIRRNISMENEIDNFTEIIINRFMKIPKNRWLKFLK